MKILLIVPHMSTGGMPQVALKRVEYLYNKHDVYMIEYRQIAWSFVVQRERVQQLLGDKFISLGNVWGDDDTKRNKFIDIVKEINPDIIHMEEMPELFTLGIKKEHCDWLYRKERTYKIIETTHTSTFNVNNKMYFPDKFIFVSKFSQKQYENFNIPSSIVEYPIEKKDRNKSESIKKLGLNPEYFHVLNVGLFTRDKNQGYIFEIAKRMLNYKIHFHFVGNMADNFSDYWLPLIENKIENCIIHGEQTKVDLFYQSADVLLHPSLLELNPLVVKEATSYDLPVYLNNLPTYLDTYDSYKNVKYLTMNIDQDINMLLNNFNISKINNNDNFSNLLINEYNKLMNINQSSNIEEQKNTENEGYYTYNISFIDGAKLEINGDVPTEFYVEFIDKKDNTVLYSDKMLNNTSRSSNIKYFVDYKINLYHNNNLIISHELDLKGRNVLIQLDSSSIGDTIAWFPYVEEFRKKHQCNVYCSTFWNSWFEKEYTDIIFLNPSNINAPNIYAKYNIGWYSPFDNKKNPIDYKKIPLQKTSSDILGIDFKEIVPKIHIPEGVKPIQDKYVCIGQFSTTNSKHWHYPFKDSNQGWQIIVDWLNEQGYKVMVISKQKTSLNNIIDMTGDFPIEHRINQLKYCEFYIGVGSGLSWLAWAIGKKVVMISGFSNPICEFKTNNINVHNYNVCNGCFNKHEFDRGDWNWCPEHKDTNRQFECSINITPNMVIDRMINSKLLTNIKNFDIEKYNKNITLNGNVYINYNKDENKFSFMYSDEIATPKINIDIIDFYTNKILYSISEVSLCKKHVVWCKPNNIIHENTNKVKIVFFERNKLLEVEYDI